MESKCSREREERERVQEFESSRVREYAQFKEGGAKVFTFGEVDKVEAKGDIAQSAKPHHRTSGLAQHVTVHIDGWRRGSRGGGRSDGWR
jgi:hypothetical protein